MHRARNRAGDLNRWVEPRNAMSDHSLTNFVDRTGNKDRGEGLFELETDRFLEISLNGSMWIKLGSMASYTGTIKFTREGILDRGVGTLFKKSFGEGVQLTRAVGSGSLFLADAGKKVSIIKLDDESLFVNGNDVLAFEDSVSYDIRMMKKIGSMLSGGLFNVRLEGTGLVAITTHFDPITLAVTPDTPVATDPNATVAWSGNLEPTLRKDFSFKTFLGRGSGESLQMKFTGDGFVVIQPGEERRAGNILQTG